MTYGDFVRMVQAKMPESGSRAGVDAAIRLVFNTIADSVIAGEPVSIPGFGKFSLSHRKARLGTNPRTGEAIQIAERMAVTFSPAERLKHDVRVVCPDAIPDPAATFEEAAVAPEEAPGPASAETSTSEGAPSVVTPKRKKRG